MIFIFPMIPQEFKSSMLRGTENTSCGGNSFQEPGAFHYLPGNAEIAMSFNGCKEPGCVRYGMKKIRVSPRLSYQEAVNKFLMYNEDVKYNSSWMMRKFDPSPRVKLNGKMTTGVKIFQSRWFDVIKCLKLSNDVSRILMNRRTKMIEAGKIYCANKQYCSGKKAF